MLARQAGTAVPDATYGNALAYLAAIEQHIPSEYGADARDTTIAYALRVRMLAGDRDTAPGRAPVGRARATTSRSRPSRGCGRWSMTRPPTAPSVSCSTTRAVDTAGAVTFTTGVSDGASVILQSDRRTDGIVARRPHRPAARQRPDPQGRHGSARCPDRRPLGQLPGEHRASSWR